MNVVHGMKFVQVVKKDSLFSLSHISYLLSLLVLRVYVCSVWGGVMHRARKREKKEKMRREK